VPRPEIPETIKIIVEDIAVSPRQSIIPDYLTHGPDHLVEFPLIIAACCQLTLQLIQFLPGAREPVLIRPERERLGLHMVQILADPFEEALPPVVATEPIVAIPVISVIVTIGAITISTITLIAIIPIARIAVIAPVWDGLAARIRWDSLTTAISGAPGQVKSIPFRAIVFVLDSNYRHSAVARIAHQRLSAAAVHPRKAEVGRICRQRPGAFKSAPLRRLPRKIPQDRAIATNLHIGRAIHYDFDGALATVRASAAHRRSAFEALATHDSARCH
jgi:hypothetical protein